MDSRLGPAERKRKEFRSRLGPAEPVFCVSCGRPNGFVSLGTPIIILCQSCQEKYPAGLPLLMPSQVTIWCERCQVAPRGIPRELLGKVVYYCEPCERLMGGKPPLEEVR